jgi:hypothetical protein
VRIPEALDAKLVALKRAERAEVAQNAWKRRERAKAQPDGRKGVLVRLERSVWEQLKIACVNETKTLQEMMEEAVQAWLAKRNGK